MLIHERDLDIISLVSRFGQLTSSHINQLIFPELRSHTPANRSLNRLVGRNQLHRIERLIGGGRGGSGQYIYELGSEGWRLDHEGRWWPAKAVNHHKLAIADCYVLLRRLEAAGRLKIVDFANEPYCHVTIGGELLKPDFVAELSRPGSGDSIRFMYEIDMATQGQRQITDKLLRYWKAYSAGDRAAWPQSQLVLFLAVHERRAEELRQLIGRGDKQQQTIFRVQTLAGLEAQLS